MTRIAEASVACTEKPAAIYTPSNIAEQTKASGFAFSKRLARQTGMTQSELSPAFFEGSQVFKHADLARKLASDSAGGATIGEIPSRFGSPRVIQRPAKRTTSGCTLASTNA
jgi:hypothetical protein